MKSSTTPDPHSGTRRPNHREASRHDNPFEILFNGIEDFLFVLDTDGNIIEVNRAVTERLGYPQHSLAGQSVLNVHPADRREEAARTVQAMIRGETDSCPIPLVTRDGHLIEVETRVTEGIWKERPALFGISRDVSHMTARRASEARLRSLSQLQHELMRLATSFVNVPVSRQDASIDEALGIAGSLIGADRAYLIRYDHARQCMNNTHEWCAEGITPEIENLQNVPMALFPDWVDAHQRGAPVHIPDVAALAPRSALREILEPQGIQSLIALPMTAPHECLGFVGFDAVRSVRKWNDDEIGLLKVLAELFTNIETRRRSDEAIRRANEDRAMLLDTMDTQVWYLKDPETYGGVNAAHAAFLGKPPGAIAFQRLDAFLTEPEAAVCRQSNLEVFQNRRQVRTQEWVKRGDGKPRLLAITKTPKLNTPGDVEYVVCTATDITDSERLREAVAISEKRYRGLIETQHALIVRVDREGRFTFVNDAYCRFFGKRREDLIGKTFHPLVHPDDLAATLEAMNALYAPPHRMSVEQRIMTPEGIRWLSWEDDAILDDQGNVTEIQGVGHDITEVKQLQEGLIHARDEARAAAYAKAMFLANMSHEIRTPLNAVLGNAQILQQTLTVNHETESAESLRAITRSGEHLLELLNQILEIVQLDVTDTTLNPVNLDLPDLIGQVRMIGGGRAGGAVSVKTRLDDELPRWIHADKGKIRQVLINLVGNAVKATVSGDVILHVYAHVRNDARARITVDVTDSGCGMDPADAERIFDPFEQTNPDGVYRKGTGLGLPLSRRYARAMGGDVILWNSEPGKGSVFRFSFEADVLSHMPGPSEISTRVPSRIAPGSPSPRILVVDDDPESLNMLSAMLQHAGFPVDADSSGEAALARVIRDPAAVDLVIMDHRMPGLNGVETMQRLRRIPGCESIPVVIVTAGGLHDARETLLEAGATGYLPKPISRNDLLEEIRRIVGVTYQYADMEPDGSESGDGSPVDLSGIPDDVRRELALAVHDGRATHMRNLVTAEIEPHAPETANGLYGMIERYDYDGLIRLLGDPC